MKKAFYVAAAAALLITSTAAQARGISFSLDGQRIRIEAPRHCMSLSCLSVTDNGSSFNMKTMNAKGRKESDAVKVASNAPQVASPVPAPAANTAPPAASSAIANAVSPAPAPSADISRERVTGMPSTAPAPAASTVPPAQAPAVVAVVAPPAPPAQQAAAADATTPFGLWQTEEGNVRVEQCGANLCGYGEKNGKKSNELILINMRPSSDHGKWAGRIHNPNSGKNYDATVAMKGPNLLKVQGCILGGAICGGTTWKRIS